MPSERAEEKRVGAGREIAGDDEREDRFLRLTGQRRVLLLVLIMTAAAVALGCIAVLILYEVAFERDRERLSDLARNMAANIAAISDSLQQSGMSADEARETALRMQTEARSQAHGLGETGEFALAERRGDTIVYRIRDRANPIDKPLILPLKPDAGSQDGPGGAMRRAIAGEAGTVVGLDYQGVPVVTAYEPLPELGAGVVVEINMAELRHPFIRAAIAIGLLGVVLVALGTTLFFRITEPMLWQLRHKERRYRHLVEQMDQGIIVLRAVDEGRDFVIRDMNPAGEAIERQPRDQLIGRRISEVLPAAVAAGMLDLCRAVRQSGVATSLHDFAYADGRRPGWRDCRIYRLSEGDIVCLFEDVTARHATEERLKQTQKLEVLGQLTGGIAHDFNNVLAIVIGNLQLLDERIDGEDKDLLSDALWAAQRGAQLTHQLLAYARQQPLHPCETNINGLIHDMTDLLRRTLHASISIKEQLAYDLWPTLIDRVQLESAIVNLIVNARDAMPSGGDLTIETVNAHLGEREKMAGAEPVVAGEYVMLAVRDTGIGMTPEVAERAFEPFYTTKGPASGSGLGLSMVYGFVKQSGGHVRVVSKEGGGTSVELFLPRVRAGAADGNAAEGDPAEGDPAPGMLAADEAAA
ncbi:MAG: ATP-binding protein [Rhodospirillales bacterium]